MPISEGEYKTEIDLQYAWTKDNNEDTIQKKSVLRISGDDIITCEDDKWLSDEKTLSAGTCLRVVMTGSVVVRSTSCEYLETEVKASLDLDFEDTYAYMYWNQLSPAPKIWVDL